MGRHHEVVVIGAGFSKPAGGPLLRELLAPEHVDPGASHAHIIGKLNALAASRPSSDLEALFTEVWQEARTGGSLFMEGRNFDAAQVWDQLSIHLTSLCSKIRLRRGTKLWALYGLYLSNLYRRSKSVTFVTFNYDLLLEQLLDDAGILYDYGNVTDLAFDDAVRRRKLNRHKREVSILKMHGSANWGFCEGCRKASNTDGMIVAFEETYVPARRRRCPFCHERLLKTGIVPPITGKAGEVKKMAEIKNARKALAKANAITIIGYSLPAGDREARSLLQGPGSMLGLEQTGSNVTIVCGPNGSAAPYSTIFPKAHDSGLYLEQFMAKQTEGAAWAR